MAAEADTKTEPTQNTTPPTPAQPPKAKNPAAVKKAIALGKEVRKQSENTKADAARAMYELISDEPREIVVQAFVDGHDLVSSLDGPPDQDAAQEWDAEISRRLAEVDAGTASLIDRKEFSKRMRARMRR